MFQYYQIEHLTEIIVSLMNREQIPYYLLKGISLAAYYPVPEYRKLGDVDLYIPDPAAFEKAKKVLEANGFVLDPELSDHHTTYIYTFPKTGRRYILELHFRIVGVYQYDKANQIVDQVFSQTPAYTRTSEDRRSHIPGASSYGIHLLYDPPYVKTLSLQRVRHPAFV